MTQPTQPLVLAQKGPRPPYYIQPGGDENIFRKGVMFDACADGMYWSIDCLNWARTTSLFYREQC
jgi:hypothetical protein